MVTKKYKTIKGLMRGNSLKEFTLSQFLDMAVFNKSKGQTIKISLDEKAESEACALFASGFLSGKDSIKKYAELIRRYSGNNYGIFRRVSILNGKKLRGYYCAGQDYISETRYVCHLLRKG